MFILDVSYADNFQSVGNEPFSNAIIKNVVNSHKLNSHFTSITGGMLSDHLPLVHLKCNRPVRNKVGSLVLLHRIVADLHRIHLDFASVGRGLRNILLAARVHISSLWRAFATAYSLRRFRHGRNAILRWAATTALHGGLIVAGVSLCGIECFVIVDCSVVSLLDGVLHHSGAIVLTSFSLKFFGGLPRSLFTAGSSTWSSSAFVAKRVYCI